jgi:serine/threonine-protein phosphatase Stp1
MGGTDQETIISASLSEKGPIRSRNADAILADDRAGFFAIADGVGSLPESAAASSFAVTQARAMYEHFISQQDNEPNLRELFALILDAYRQNFRSGIEIPKTTLSLGYLNSSAFHYASIGDSPILLIENDTIRLLTNRHTVVDRFEVFTDFSLMKSFSGSNVLYNSLGLRETLPNTYKPIEIRAPYRLLFASDGIFNFLSQAELLEISQMSAAPQHFVEHVASAARATQPEDNYSLIVVDSVHKTPPNIDG